MPFFRYFNSPHLKFVLGLDGEQFLSYSHLEIGRQKLLTCLQSQPLPLSPKSNLKWIGFTDEGSLASADSTGILRIKYNKLWRPLCDLDDHVIFILLHPANNIVQ
jgi:chromosome transmission fidelity protein 4